MKLKCEKCEVDTPLHQAKVYTCSYECTFCSSCSEKMKFICPNCQGKLIERLKKNKK